LPLATGWLSAKDACSVCCVCKAWRDTIMEKDLLWKQICENTRPEATRSVLAVQPEWNFRHLTRSLASGLPEVELDPIPDPLPFEQIFAVVELYKSQDIEGERRRIVIASWTCDPAISNTSYLYDVYTNPGLVLKGANPYASSPEFARIRGQEEALSAWKGYQYGNAMKDAFYFAFSDVSGGNEYGDCREDILRVKVILFRRDNMKSVCIMDEPVSGLANRNDENPLVTSKYVEVWGDDLDFDNTAEGTRARLLLEHNKKKENFEEIKPKASFDLRICTPWAGSEETPQPLWFTELLASPFHLPASLEGRNALSKIPSFEIELCDFLFDVHETARDYMFEDEKRVFLDGLCWR